MQEGANARMNWKSGYQHMMQEFLAEMAKLQKLLLTNAAPYKINQPIF